MDQKELIDLILKLRDMDNTKKFESQITVLEHQIQTSIQDEKAYDLFMTEYNRLAKEIDDENELMKLEI